MPITISFTEFFSQKKNVPPLMSYDVTKNKEENPLNPLKNHWKKSAG